MNEFVFLDALFFRGLSLHMKFDCLMSSISSITGLAPSVLRNFLVPTCGFFVLMISVLFFLFLRCLSKIIALLCELF